MLTSLIIATALFAGGSDSPTPYTVDQHGITLPAGDVFELNDHINLKTSEGPRSLHLDGKGWDEKLIGKNSVVWSAFLLNGDFCVSWVQVSGYNEHFGEGGQKPVCTYPTTPTIPVPVPTDPTLPEPPVVVPPVVTPEPTPEPTTPVIPVPVPTDPTLPETPVVTPEPLPTGPPVAPVKPLPTPAPEKTTKPLNPRPVVTTPIEKPAAPVKDTPASPTPAEVRTSTVNNVAKPLAKTTTIEPKHQAAQLAETGVSSWGMVVLAATLSIGGGFILGYSLRKAEFRRKR